MSWKIEAYNVRTIGGNEPDTNEMFVSIITPENAKIELPPAAIRKVILTSDSPVPTAGSIARLRVGKLQLDMPREHGAELAEACKLAEEANGP